MNRQFAPTATTDERRTAQDADGEVTEATPRSASIHGDTCEDDIPLLLYTLKSVYLESRARYPDIGPSAFFDTLECALRKTPRAEQGSFLFTLAWIAATFSDAEFKSSPGDALPGTLSKGGRAPGDDVFHHDPLSPGSFADFRRCACIYALRALTRRGENGASPIDEITGQESNFALPLFNVPLYAYAVSSAPTEFTREGDEKSALEVCVKVLCGLHRNDKLREAPSAEHFLHPARLRLGVLGDADHASRSASRTETLFHLPAPFNVGPVNREDICSICWDNLDESAVAMHEGGHMFHRECASAWLKNKRFEERCCPLCRRKMTTHPFASARFRHLRTLREVFEFMLEVHALAAKSEGHHERVDESAARRPSFSAYINEHFDDYDDGDFYDFGDYGDFFDFDDQSVAQPGGDRSMEELRASNRPYCRYFTTRNPFDDHGDDWFINTYGPHIGWALHKRPLHHVVDAIIAGKL